METQWSGEPKAESSGTLQQGAVINKTLIRTDHPVVCNARGNIIGPVTIGDEQGRILYFNAGVVDELGVRRNPSKQKVP